ncbi:unnamed protein product [Pylaiella littoralis]
MRPVQFVISPSKRTYNVHMKEHDGETERLKHTVRCHKNSHTAGQLPNGEAR